MNPDAVQKYCTLMTEIKRRTAVIDAFSAGITHALYKATTIESTYLQFRKMLELIALGSLVANKDAFSSVYQGFAKYWNAELLMKDIERINPGFYPRPIIQEQSTEPGIAMNWVDRQHDYLTRDELIKLYKKCGAIMHAANPYGSQVDLAYYEARIPYWRDRVRNLLNSHNIALVNDPNIYLIQMGAIGEPPTYTPFAPAPQPEA
ncbi:MAG: hypothetical protein M3O61_07900 [Gemmatimonadota bacterium]|nr:hypothetical protein [Gemmatimonadota bacterium]